MPIWHDGAMRVRELIDALSDLPPDSLVELAVIEPDVPGSDQIVVDRYPVDGVFPWTGDDEEDDGEPVIWLIGGEEADVDAFLDAIDDDGLD